MLILTCYIHKRNERSLSIYLYISIYRITFELIAGATKIKVHGVVIFNCWNYRGNKFQE